MHQLNERQIEAGMAMRRAQGEDITDRYSAVNFAIVLGYKSVAAFEADRAKGIIPAPDGVFNGFPYWRRATIEKTKGARDE